MHQRLDKRYLAERIEIGLLVVCYGGVNAWDDEQGRTELNRLTELIRTHRLIIALSLGIFLDACSLFKLTPIIGMHMFLR